MNVLIKSKSIFFLSLATILVVNNFINALWQLVQEFDFQIAKHL